MPLSTDRARNDPVLIRRLRDIPDVEDVVLAEGAIWLICRSAGATGPAADLAAEVLRAEIGPGSGPAVRTAVLMGPRSIEGRLRFQRVERREEPEVRVRFRVALHWDGSEVWGEALGEKGEGLELRTVALATLDAIERTTGRTVDVRVVGIKRVRVFDTDLMVVSLARAGATAQRYVGAVVVGKDIWRSAVFAVLHALNRVLGNILATR